MDFAYRTTTEWLAAFAAGEATSLGLLDAQLARIEAKDGPINAVVALDADTARDRAREADAARARGESWGPLHGIPMTVKDSFEAVGMPTTSGAPELADHRPARDADAVARLRAAGAVVFGKTNLPLYASDLQSYNDVYGTTNNPWDTSRGPGGSSGGSAAALAAGYTPLELGSDIAGSIRNPSHFCGVFGHKPTHGIVSIRGHIPGPPGILSTPDLSVAGPMARSVEDLELALDILAGPAPADDIAWSFTLPAARHEALGDYRVAVWADAPGHPIGNAVATAVEAAVAVIEKHAARVDRKARPALDAEDTHARYLRLLWGVMGAGMPPAVQQGLDAALPGLDPADASVNAQMIRGAAGQHRSWLVDNEVRNHLRVRWAEFFRDFDVLLCPVAPTPAFPHDHSPFESRTLDIDGTTVPYLDPIFWAGLATLVGLPVTVIPIGRSAEGLPIGIQVVAPHLEDRTALRFAQGLSRELGGFQAPPGFEA